MEDIALPLYLAEDVALIPCSTENISVQRPADFVDDVVVPPSADFADDIVIISP